MSQSIKYLRNYAEWYYTKYFPSVRTLYEKLQKKTEESGIVDQVMTELAPLFVEEQNIESRVHAMIDQGKTARVIWTKLRQKKFDRDILEKILENYADKLDSPETYRKKIILSIEKARKKGESKRTLSYRLKMEYSSAGELIDELLADYDDREILEEIVPTLTKKYPSEKLFQKLMQKGFMISDIRSVFRANS